MKLVMDSSALIAYLVGEEGVDIVREHLLAGDTLCYAHAINLCEVYYDFISRTGEDLALQALEDLMATGLIAREDMDPAFWQQAGRLKAQVGLSLADCFCLTLAERLEGQLVTSDHHEFDPLAQEGLHNIRFIR